MKPRLLILPIIALGVAGAWNGKQSRLISNLERQNVVLRQAIAARSSDNTEDSPQGMSATPAQATKDKQRIHWKQVAGQFEDMQRRGGIDNMRASLRLQQRLEAMNAEEVMAALDEIAALDLPANTRLMLEQMIMGSLAAKDPELALTKFIDRVHDGNGTFTFQLAHCLRQWAQKDPTAACAWFDQQITAGKFVSKSLDGRSQARIQFEGQMIHALLGSDAAARRLAAMPEDDRDDVLSQHSYQELKDEDQLAFAQIVRDQLSVKDQARTLAQQASRLVGKQDYTKVTGFLDRIQATSAERNACVQAAAVSSIQSISYQNKVTREDIDSMREWVDSQAPESTALATGRALAKALDGRRMMEFSEAAELALHYHQATGNDNVLTSFLSHGSESRNKEQARVLAARISDAKRREEILRNLK